MYDQYIQFSKLSALPPSEQPKPQRPKMSVQIGHDEFSNASFMLKSLPKMTIPEFSGNSVDWPHFRDIFTSLVHSQNYPLVLKLGCLRNYLKREALVFINSFAISSKNYASAFDSLRLFYENERLQVHTHLSSLFTVELMTRNSYTEIRRLLKNLHLPWRINCFRKNKSWPDILVHMLVNNMDKVTRLDWKKSLGRTTIVPSLDRVKTFLQGQALIYESLERLASVAVSLSVRTIPRERLFWVNRSQSLLRQSKQLTL